MFNLLFLSNLETINKYFRFRFRNYIKLFSLLKNRAMSFIDTQGVDFDIILFNLICTNVGFTLFQFINQQSSNCWILRDVNNVGIVLRLLKVSSTDNCQTCFFQCLISALLQFFLSFTFLLQLFFKFFLWFHYIFQLFNFIFQK